ncbi:MAG TPA: SRPBCC family protein [Solirubrobacteraceae bacterium]|nr:SRPBCC family protein [Solirubrobacteraceae bacterium]
MTYRLDSEQLVRAPLEQIFEFFSRARNLEELTPPWLRFSVLTPEPIEMRAGTLIEYRLRVRGVPLRWVSRIEEWQPGRRFVDRQLKGPYRLWCHTHEFAADPRGTLIRDSVCYEIPLGRLGALVHAAVVRRDLERVFDYRRQRVERQFPGAGMQTEP